MARKISRRQQREDHVRAVFDLIEQIRRGDDIEVNWNHPIGRDALFLMGIETGHITFEVPGLIPKPAETARAQRSNTARTEPEPSPECDQVTPEALPAPSPSAQERRRQELAATAARVAEEQRQRMGWPPLPPPEPRRPRRGVVPPTPVPAPSWDRQKHGSKLYGWSAEDNNPTFTEWPEDG